VKRKVRRKVGQKGAAPDLGQRLAAQRSERGLSQSAVAYRAGLAASYLSRIENGKIQPTVPTAQKIAKALRVPLSELLAPSPTQQKGQGCPVTAQGMCLIDLIDPKGEFHSERQGENYTSRQIRMLRRFATLLREGSPELLRGVDLVVTNLLEQNGAVKKLKVRRKTKTSKRPKRRS